MFELYILGVIAYLLISVLTLVFMKKFMHVPGLTGIGAACIAMVWPLLWTMLIADALVDFIHMFAQPLNNWWNS